MESIGKVAFKRLVAKITKENLWIYILKMLSERPMYAYEMSKDLMEIFGFSTARVTVYVILYKMRKEGLIRPTLEKTVHNRPVRKYYEITEIGKKTLLQGRKFLKEIVCLLEE